MNSERNDPGEEGVPVLELTVQGGRPVPLLFVRRGEQLEVLVSDPRAGWYARALAGAPVTVRADGRELRNCRAQLETDRVAVEGARAAFVLRYGEERVRRYFGPASRLLTLAPPHGAVLGDYETRVREEFDVVAPLYLERLGGDPVGRYLKRRSLDRLRALFRGRDPLLEIGAGVGAETLPLLSEGHRITVVDISPGMLSALRDRARDVGAEGRLDTLVGRAGKLGEVLGTDRREPFGGAYSTFGALNLDRDLSELGETLARALAPGSPFFVGVLNRHAPMPLIYPLVNRRPREASSRLRSPIPAGGTAFPLEVYATTPARFTALVGPRFRLEGVEGASFLAPPVTYPRALEVLGAQGLRKATRLDAWLSRGPAAWFSEWVFLTYRLVG